MSALAQFPTPASATLIFPIYETTLDAATPMSSYYKSRKPCKSNLKCSFESCKVSLKASVRRLDVIHTLQNNLRHTRPRFEVSIQNADAFVPGGLFAACLNLRTRS